MGACVASKTSRLHELAAAHGCKRGHDGREIDTPVAIETFSPAKRVVSFAAAHHAHGEMVLGLVGAHRPHEISDGKHKSARYVA